MGPSPLARGKHYCGHCCRCGCGTIPARAGETAEHGYSQLANGDHPRSRGGNFTTLEHTIMSTGPSPLARGKLKRRADGRWRRRTIPARAGETQNELEMQRLNRDHPRSRGGNRASCARKWSSTGPSPLARGKLKSLSKEKGTPGTIPARAGETSAFRGRRGMPGDHPRSRGGNRRINQSERPNPGPSPLARGKPGPLRSHQPGTGTIPARAGETSSTPASRSLTKDHPRSRGGNAAFSRASGIDVGPSPLARGKRALVGALVGALGTIPARAGETLGCAQGPDGQKDHPRSRGGNPATPPLRP